MGNRLIDVFVALEVILFSPSLRSLSLSLYLSLFLSLVATRMYWSHMAWRLDFRDTRMPDLCTKQCVWVSFHALGKNIWTHAKNVI